MPALGYGVQGPIQFGPLPGPAPAPPAPTDPGSFDPNSAFTLTPGGSGGGGSSSWRNPQDPATNFLYGLQDQQLALRTQLGVTPIAYQTAKDATIGRENLNKFNLDQKLADILAQQQAAQRNVAVQMPQIRGQAAAQGVTTSKGTRVNYEQAWYDFLQGQQSLDRQAETARVATFYENAILNGRQAVADAKYFGTMSQLNAQAQRPGLYGGLGQPAAPFGG
jgi:hypothetical protein